MIKPAVRTEFRAREDCEPLFTLQHSYALFSAKDRSRYDRDAHNHVRTRANVHSSRLRPPTLNASNGSQPARRARGLTPRCSAARRSPWRLPPFYTRDTQIACLPFGDRMAGTVCSTLRGDAASAGSLLHQRARQDSAERGNRPRWSMRRRASDAPVMRPPQRGRILLIAGGECASALRRELERSKMHIHARDTSASGQLASREIGGNPVTRCFRFSMHGIEWQPGLYITSRCSQLVML